MGEQITELLIMAFEAGSNFFSNIMASLKGTGAVWAVGICLYQVNRFLLTPIFGGAGSDRASKKQNKSGGEEQ